MSTSLQNSQKRVTLRKENILRFRIYQTMPCHIQETIIYLVVSMRISDLSKCYF